MKILFILQPNFQGFILLYKFQIYFICFIYFIYFICLFILFIISLGFEIKCFLNWPDVKNNMLKSNLNCCVQSKVQIEIICTQLKKEKPFGHIAQNNKMDTNSGQDSIQVFIRIKPIRQQQGVLTYSQTQIRLDRHQFAFDKIFPPSATQTDIFHDVGYKVLNNVLDGYNSSVFVYGQTGSGKTHTMIGQNNGLMQQAFHQLFSRINRMKNAECFVTCSYFELYNEQIMDLLQPKKQKKLNIRQDAKKGVFVQNLTEQAAFDCQKLMDVLYTGMKNRHIGQTQMNKQSSRSHSVFTISLSCKTQEDGKKVLKTPKLHFVDLAGAEKQKMTQASGDRLKEAGNINRSLTTLGMVINALTSQKPRSHIPYRDSKLTCLLRDSLGGNSKTIIIATVASTALSFQETLSTLNFANRAKMVKVKALVNEESLSTNIQVFKQEIRRLKSQVARLKSQHHRTPIKIMSQEVMSPKRIGTQFQHHFEQINKKISAISEQLTQGVTSPSLQALLSNLQSKKTIISTETMMQQQNCEDVQSNGSMQKYSPVQFVEYLNSNYELLTQINTKVNQYLEMKDQLRHAAMNRKLAIQNMRTPSKFERDQYEQLLTKRQNEIRGLDDRTQQLESRMNQAVLQKKDLQRKLQMHKESNSETSDSMIKLKESLLRAQNQAQKQRTDILKLRNQILRVQKLNQQLQARFKQTKQLHLYAQQKYENQRYTTSKLTCRLDQAEKDLQHQRKLGQNSKEEKKELSNEIDNLKMALEDREGNQQELRNELTEMEETLEFNKKVIEEITKKNTAANNELIRAKENIGQISLKNHELNYQNQKLTQKQALQSQSYTNQLQQKAVQVKQMSLNNQKLTHEMLALNRELLQQKRLKQSQLSKSRELASEIKRALMQKQAQLSKSCNQLQVVSDQAFKLRSQKQSLVQNYAMKIQAKTIECNMLEQQYNQHKKQSQSLVQQLKRQSQAGNMKVNALTEEKLKIQTQNKQVSLKLGQCEAKMASIQHVFSQNQQLKRSYKQTVKENYRLKGKYQTVNENQQVQKQRSEELLSKVQFYEEKFKLMSIQYHKVQSIIKRLKEKQLQSNKKIQFYEQNMKLRDIQRSYGEESQERDKLICELKQENRELKYRLDNLEGNQMGGKKAQSSAMNSLTGKKPKEERQTVSFNVKYDKLRTRLSGLMKNWEGFDNQSHKQHSTQQMIDLCQVMLNQNVIKFQTVAKGIRRQQKLKSQNHFILKENIYLKQKIQQLQKSDTIKDQKQSQSKPRKMVKSD